MLNFEWSLRDLIISFENEPSYIQYTHGIWEKKYVKSHY